MVGYSKVLTTTVIRTVHRVTICDNLPAYVIVEYLSKVPGNAKLISLDQPEDSRETIFEFEDEEAAK